MSVYSAQLPSPTDSGGLPQKHSAPSSSPAPQSSDDGSSDSRLPGEDLHNTLTSQSLNADGTPKRPMNAFMIFARRRRPQVSAANQMMRTGEISKILSKEWNAMAISEKQFYLDQAKRLKDTFNTRYPDYVYRRRPNNSRKKRRTDVAPYTTSTTAMNDLDDPEPLDDQHSPLASPITETYSYAPPPPQYGYDSTGHHHTQQQQLPRLLWAPNPSAVADSAPSSASSTSTSTASPALTDPGPYHDEWVRGTSWPSMSGGGASTPHQGGRQRAFTTPSLKSDDLYRAAIGVPNNNNANQSPNYFPTLTAPYFPATHPVPPHHHPQQHHHHRLTPPPSSSVVTSSSASNTPTTYYSAPAPATAPPTAASFFTLQHHHQTHQSPARAASYYWDAVKQEERTI